MPRRIYPYGLFRYTLVLALLRIPLYGAGMRAALMILLLPALACTDTLGEVTTKPLPQPDPYPPKFGESARSPRIANYRIEARFDAKEHRISATERLTWKNTGQSPVTMLPFHLYMNAFKNEESIFMSESGGRHRSARATSSGWGWIEVSTLKVGGIDATARLIYPHTPDETVVHVPLEQPVLPGATIEVDVDFEVQLPEVFARTGYKGAFTMVGQWFPKIGVLVGEPGQETWHCKPFHLNSEFFADFGTYDVTLTVPQTHVIAATGVLAKAVDNEDGTRTLTYRAEDVHDFAWMADPYMKVMSAQADTDNGAVEVRVYYREPQEAFARRHLHAGVGAIEHFSRLFYTYPWPLMSVIDPPPDAAGGAGGMEYPTLVTTAGDSVFMRPGMYMPEGVTVHEIGHNWFQGILASNEVDEAWMDEGVNEYADGLVMDALYGEGTSSMSWMGLYADYQAIKQAAPPMPSALPVPIATHSYKFPDFGSYASASYNKTSLALRTLEHVVGTEQFRYAMREYAHRFAFRHPTGADLFATLEEKLGRDLDWFIEPAFHGLSAANYTIRDIDCKKAHKPRGVFGRGEERKVIGKDEAPETDQWLCDIVVSSLGRIQAPTQVLIEYTDGTSVTKDWHPSDEEPWQRFQVESKSPVSRVTIDPHRKLLISDQPLDQHERHEPESAGARRAAARVHFWAQTAMQVFGL